MAVGVAWYPAALTLSPGQMDTKSVEQNSLCVRFWGKLVRQDPLNQAHKTDLSHKAEQLTDRKLSGVFHSS